MNSYPKHLNSIVCIYTFCIIFPLI